MPRDREIKIRSVQLLAQRLELMCAVPNKYQIYKTTQV
jgi:hypothetical protein